MSTGATWSASFGGAPVPAMQVYDEIMVPRIFEPWASLMVELLEIGPGQSVLDVACGPGSVARIAAQRVGAGGQVVACDLSSAMLAVAKAKPSLDAQTEITYLEAPADRLPVADATFDVVTCQQGLQFFPERSAAVAEMHRTLRPGGQAGVAVWTEIERAPVWSALGEALQRVLGSEIADGLRNGPWGFPNPEPLRELLEHGGFREVDMSKHALPLRFEGGPAQVVATLAATGIADRIEPLPAEQKQELVDTLATLAGDGPIDSEMESNIAIARR